MSKRSNRRSKGKRARALLSLRAELTLLYDGAPMPKHYLESNLTDTRGYVSMKKYMLDNGLARAYGAVPQNPYQAQLDAAAKQLQEDIDKELIRSLMVGPSLDT
jgi:hypothetical protein